VGRVEQSTPQRNTSTKPREKAWKLYLPSMAHLQAPPRPWMIVLCRGEEVGRKAMQRRGTKLRTKHPCVRGSVNVGHRGWEGGRGGGLP
jgi:hypothetical protein